MWKWRWFLTDVGCLEMQNAASANLSWASTNHIGRSGGLDVILQRRFRNRTASQGYAHVSLWRNAALTCNATYPFLHIRKAAITHRCVMTAWEIMYMMFNNKQF